MYAASVGVAGKSIRVDRRRDRCRTHAARTPSGIHPEVVSKRLGHRAVSITLHTSSHVPPDLQDEAAQRMANLV